MWIQDVGFEVQNFKCRVQISFDCLTSVAKWVRGRDIVCLESASTWGSALHVKTVFGGTVPVAFDLVEDGASPSQEGYPLTRSRFKQGLMEKTSRGEEEEPASGNDVPECAIPKSTFEAGQVTSGLLTEIAEASGQSVGEIVCQLIQDEPVSG